MLDPDALTGKPVLIGANAGTARHSLAIDYAIRPLFAYLHAEAVATGVFAASSDWGGSADRVAPLSERVDRGARELAEAVARREPVASSDPFDPANYLGEGRSFGHLLGGLAGEYPRPLLASGAMRPRQGAPLQTDVLRRVEFAPSVAPRGRCTEHVGGDERTEVDPGQLADVRDRHLEGAEAAERRDRDDSLGRCR